jgi:hypothetical protein
MWDNGYLRSHSLQAELPLSREAKISARCFVTRDKKKCGAHRPNESNLLLTYYAFHLLQIHSPWVQSLQQICSCLGKSMTTTTLRRSTGPSIWNDVSRLLGRLEFRVTGLSILLINRNTHQTKVISSGTIVAVAISEAKNYIGNIVYCDSGFFILIWEIHARLDVKRISYIILSNNSHVEVIPTIIPVFLNQFVQRFFRTVLLGI